MRQQNSGAVEVYFTVFRSLSTIPKVKELLKSVHICRSYRKNKSGTFLWPTVYIVYNIKHVLRLPHASHGVIFDTALIAT